jgi:hypothetical protein
VRFVAAIAVSVFLHAIVSMGLVAQTLDSELPEPFDRGIICVFPPPPHELTALFIGLTDTEVRRVLKDVSNVEPTIPSACVRYQFESGGAITLFFRAGLVEAVTFGPRSAPEHCRSRPIRVTMLPSVG